MKPAVRAGASSAVACPASTRDPRLRPAWWLAVLLMLAQLLVAAHAFGHALGHDDEDGPAHCVLCLTADRTTAAPGASHALAPAATRVARAMPAGDHAGIAAASPITPSARAPPGDPGVRASSPTLP